jgi:hypothetical protein
VEASVRQVPIGIIAREPKKRETKAKTEIIMSVYIILLLVSNLAKIASFLTV